MNGGCAACQKEGFAVWKNGYTRVDILRCACGVALPFYIGKVGLAPACLTLECGFHEGYLDSGGKA
ncbi:hypothetical protein AAKU55_001171 [Oxalobacteraceae bacterium GrIS 1.11]